jgi:hypothetical protein
MELLPVLGKKGEDQVLPFPKNIVIPYLVFITAVLSLVIEKVLMRMEKLPHRRLGRCFFLDPIKFHL